MTRERPTLVAVTMVMSCLVAAGIPSMASADTSAEAPGALRSAPPPLEVPAPAEPETAAPAPTSPDADVATPTEAPTDAGPSPATAAEAVAPSSTETAPATAPPISADLLDAAPAEPAAIAPAKVTPRAATPEPEPPTPNEAVTRTWGPKFRPNANPGRLNVTARLLFANAGAAGAGGGRFGGASADVGQSWNRFGYAVTASAYGGRFSTTESGTTEVNALLGVGPTVGLGRLALLGRGFLDLRAGYDFFYGVVNQRGDATVLRPQSDDNVTLQPTRNVVPHGPRVRLDLGLVALDDSRRYWHAFGVSMGYQALIGSFRGEMPRTHILTLGLSYWMG